MVPTIHINIKVVVTQKVIVIPGNHRYPFFKKNMALFNFFFINPTLQKIIWRTLGWNGISKNWRQPTTYRQFLLNIFGGWQHFFLHSSTPVYQKLTFDITRRARETTTVVQHAHIKIIFLPNVSKISINLKRLCFVFEYID